MRRIRDRTTRRLVTGTVPPMPSLRDLEPADLDAVYRINQANVPEVGEITRARLAELYEMAAISTGVFDESGAVLGFCIVFATGADYDSANYAWFMDRYADFFYLDRVAFDASAQRRGLGTRLYDHVEDWIREQHPEVVRLTLEVNTNPPNEPSHRFHADRGYVEVGRQATPYGAEVAMMEKRLH